MEIRNPYRTDVTDEEWAFVVQYLILLDPARPRTPRTPPA